MKVTKVLVNENTQIDISDKTAEVSSVKTGITAHTSSGNQIVGDCELGEVEKVWCTATSTGAVTLNNGTNNNGTYIFNPTVLDQTRSLLMKGLTYKWYEIEDFPVRIQFDYVVTGLVQGGYIHITHATFSSRDLTNTTRESYGTFGNVGSGQSGSLSGHFDKTVSGLKMTTGTPSDNYYFGFQIFAYTGAGSHVEISNIKFEIEMTVEDAIITRHISGEYTNSEVTSIGNSRLRGCSQLSGANFPNVSTVGTYAFDQCGNLQSVSIPNITTIQEACFRSAGLTYASFPSVTTIRASAFQGCSALESVFFPNLIEIYSSAFQGCSALTEISFPKATYITGTTVFNNCSNLSSVYLPVYKANTNIGFTNCTSLTSVAFPRCLNAPIFNGCTNLSIADLYLCQAGNTAGTGQATLGNNNNFANCSNLKTLIIRYPLTVAGMRYSSCFANTPYSSGGTGGVVYVPNRLISFYQVATNWALFYGYGTMTFSAIEGSIYEDKYGDGTTCNWWDYEWDYTDGLLSENGWTKTINGTASETLSLDGLLISSGGTSNDYITLSKPDFDEYANTMIELVLIFNDLASSGSNNTIVQLGTSAYGGTRLYVSGGNLYINSTSVGAISSGVQYKFLIGFGGTPNSGTNPLGYVFVDDVRKSNNARSTSYKTTFIRSICQNGSTTIKSIKVKNLLW